MGSYFSKKTKPVEPPFESLERKIYALSPNSYPSFEKTLDWSKTKHVYSDFICIHEKYVSWSVIGTLFVLLISFLYLSYSGKGTLPLDESQDINIGEDVQ